MSAAPAVGASGARPEAEDRRWMAAALALGARHLGRTWPNPSVGAVLVREGPDGPVVVGRGVTRPGGRPHAEPVALAGAGEAARGAALYVTLEPCSHHGRTPPCAEAVIAAGVARVVSAMADPNPLVAGRGHALLRAAGIAVTAGVLGAEAARAHRGHVARVTRGRPAVTLKLARTGDGYAGRAGARLLITGEAANAGVHLLRAHSDAVMVGIGTVLADDPRLDVRLPGLEERRPVRVLLDTDLRTPPASRLVRTARIHPTWIVAAESADAAAADVLAAAGAEIIRAPTGPDGRLDLDAALRLLAERGLTRVLCEGGPALAEALATADLVDEAVILTSPTLLGEAGLPAQGPALLAALADPARFALLDARRLGADLMHHHERLR